MRPSTIVKAGCCFGAGVLAYLAIAMLWAWSAFDAALASAPVPAPTSAPTSAPVHLSAWQERCCCRSRTRPFIGTTA